MGKTFERIFFNEHKFLNMTFLTIESTKFNRPFTQPLKLNSCVGLKKVNLKRAEK